MGSRVWPKSAEDHYILGLWLADGYWWSSSVGLSSSDPRLIERFRAFLTRKAPNSVLKTRIYRPISGQKRKKVAFHIYVNSRPLTRLIFSYKKGTLVIPKVFIPAYLAGRIDGDGSIDIGNRTRVRITYSDRDDAERDAKVFGKANVSLYHYMAAHTWVLYLRKKFWDKVLPKVKRYSVKLLPRRD